MKLLNEIIIVGVTFISTEMQIGRKLATSGSLNVRFNTRLYANRPIRELFPNPPYKTNEESRFLVKLEIETCKSFSTA